MTIRNNYAMLAIILISLVSLSFGCVSSSVKRSKTLSQTPPPATLKLATTTSTENTGLLAYLLPAFEKQYNCKIQVIAVGTGKALAIARDGNVDALLVHDKISELEFVEQGWGVDRREVMYNDFLIVGPSADPAGVRGMNHAASALNSIAQVQSVFISRGDDSGTHKKELRLWDVAGVTPEGAWYREVGQGMEKVLRMADEMGAYTLTDRGTYLSVRKTLSTLVPLVQGDPELYNLYGVMAVNPDKQGGKKINRELAGKFVDWIASPETARLIEDFKVDGETLFHALKLQNAE